MLNTTKNTSTTNANKNKINNIKPLGKKNIQSELKKKTAFHRSLEAFSDCV
jgi:hypothetical protein